MVGTITYDPSTNAITAVGGTVDTPIGLVDLYNADLAGTRTLMAAKASPFTASLDTQIKPCESLALKLSCVITNFSVAGTVAFTGKDAWGNAQTETVNITSNGTFTTTKYFSSVDTNGVVAAGTFIVAVTQPRWGVLWRQGTVQYAFECKLIAGDGSTATYLGDTNKQVVWADGISTASGQVMLDILTNATATFGTLNDLTTKRTSSGCSLITLESTYRQFFIRTNSGTLYLYSCLLSAPNISSGTMVLRSLTDTTRIWNTILVRYVEIGMSGAANIYHVTSSQSLYAINGPAVAGAVDDLVCLSDYYVTYATGTKPTYKNVIAKGNSKVGDLFTTNDVYFINGILDSWSVNSFYSSTQKLYRQYEFDLTVTDKDNNPLSSASATLKDKDGNTVFSVTTDANGNIATQTISRGYYDQAHGDTLQEYSPHTLTVSKAGYQTYVKKFVLAEKTKWAIKLAKAVPVLSGLGQPILNLKATDPENAVVLPL
jgi:hypothetical protein